ncbi:hypothetical protein LTR53_020076, partial [Teratosphaeriaceae sp. CCFEE 6253]
MTVSDSVRTALANGEWDTTANQAASEGGVTHAHANGAEQATKVGIASSAMLIDTADPFEPANHAISPDEAHSV